MNLTEQIPETRKKIKLTELGDDYEPPINPSKLYRMAGRPTKSPYDFKKIKKRRKMAKESKKKNNR